MKPESAEKISTARFYRRAGGLASIRLLLCSLGTAVALRAGQSRWWVIYRHRYFFQRGHVDYELISSGFLTELLV